MNHQKLSVITFFLALFYCFPSMAQSQPSLYERLGGVYGIAPVVEDFVTRVNDNEILNANPAINEARKRISKAGLVYQVTAFMCQATGGPQNYTGRSMPKAHEHLNITEEQWQAMMVDFKETLIAFEVPQQEQDELIKLVESTKSSIVME